ncbi:MAG: hypothetical protein OEZ02_02430 [Anaerolineae bacterium]|nr:hypothetical protein [Anaerolineae bacterium]
MSKIFLHTIASIKAEIAQPQGSSDKLGLLARGLRWHNHIETEEMAALMELAVYIQGSHAVDCWEVQRVVLEILTERAELLHLPYLLETFYQKGKRGDDRRRLALKALSRVAAHTGDPQALQALESGLAHVKKDTRGWSIGYLMDSYSCLERPLPQTVVQRLHTIAAQDPSPDVRVEAVSALAQLGLADEQAVSAVLAAAQAMQPQEHQH